MRYVKLEGVTPEPESVELAADGLLFIFPIAEPGRPSIVTFELQPERFGLLTGRAALARTAARPSGTDPQVQFSQFIYP